MNLITFIACFMFRYFCQSWLICLENKEKIMVFRIFLYTISKLFWDELMYFLVIIVCFSYLLRKLLLKIAEGSFSVLFYFHYDESNYLYCIYVFGHFCQSWLICLKKKEKIMGFRIFFYRISKFIWGMSLADRPIICKTLQFLVTNIILSTWIQDSRCKAQKKKLQSNLFGFKTQGSRLRKTFFNPTSLDSRFKTQGSEKTSSIQPLWIQDSRLRKNFFNPTSLDSRFKMEGWRPSDSSFFWNLESWILNPTS